MALAFLVVAIVASANVFLQHYYNGKKEDLDTYRENVSELNQSVLNAQLYQSRFIADDLTDRTFYLILTTSNLNRLFDETNNQLHQIGNLKKLPFADRPSIRPKLDSLESFVTQLNGLHHKLIEKSLKTGFQDFGLIGEMRQYAHELESNHLDCILEKDVLMLRRHEKDFIIRRDNGYADKFNKKVAEIGQSLESKEKNLDIVECMRVLNSYVRTFNQMVELKKEIGFNSTSGGIQTDIVVNTNQILGTASLLEESVNEIAHQDLSIIRGLFIVGLIVTSLITILVVIKLSKVMSNSLRTLSTQVSQFVHSDFKENFALDSYEKRKDEIGDLYQSIKLLGEEVTIHFKNYRENAEQKHREILAKNVKIEDQKRLLEQKGNLLQSRNRSLMDSLIYAKRIQTALLPSSESLRSKIGKNTLVFIPKDVVSGDFYWVEDTHDSIYFAVGDCTGHGVPGAFMSILGVNYLNQAVKQENLKDPGKILDYLDKSISHLLNQYSSEEEIKDGMDIILCRYKKETNEVEYSGGNRPLYIISFDKLVKLETQRLSIGGLKYPKNTEHFETQILTIQDDETLFLASDGYADQFGGRTDKKMKSVGLEALLKETAKYSPRDASRILIRSYLKWRGDKEQIDDICILGVHASELLQKSETAVEVEIYQNKEA
jgi:serine phosphatase RsbU (regulator of sigma subunit)